MCVRSDIMKYDSEIWKSSDILRSVGIKQSHWPDYMMPFFALVMMESRLRREKSRLMTEENYDLEDVKEELIEYGKGYNEAVVMQDISLSELVATDRDFNRRFQDWLSAWDFETKELLGIEQRDDQTFMDIQKYIKSLAGKKVLYGYIAAWSNVDLKDYDNSDITTLEEHIKRRWADISAETAGEQYTPDDVFELSTMLIQENLASRDETSSVSVYDMTCGGGNMLFGVEDKLVAENNNLLVSTYGQEISEQLYALAKIESRFREDSEIAYGNTLTDDKFGNKQFDYIVANPPYGVDWKEHKDTIKHDETDRYVNTDVSVSDGQLMFMQHAIAKLNENGFGVIVHNGSPMFSGDVTSGESQVRKWLLDNDYIEAWVQLPKEEFFNTQITTYLWILNKNKAPERKDKILLINAADKFSKLKKSKGKKTNFMDVEHRKWVAEAFKNFGADDENVKVLSKYDFYYNKQQLTLIDTDEEGKSFYDISDKPVKVSIDHCIVNGKPFMLNQYVASEEGLIIAKNDLDALNAGLSSSIEIPHVKNKFLNGAVLQEGAEYKPTLLLNDLSVGAGQIELKLSLTKATKTKPAQLKLVAEVKALAQKDYEIIPYHDGEEANSAEIQAFLDKWVRKRYVLGDNSVGVEVNFNKIFYKPVVLRSTAEIAADIKAIDVELAELEKELWG